LGICVINGTYDIFEETVLQSKGLSIDNPESINQLPVSAIFLSNFWRLTALCLFNKLKNQKVPFRQKEFDTIESKLLFAV
jgi:hypothetical protein